MGADDNQTDFVLFGIVYDAFINQAALNSFDYVEFAELSRNKAVELLFVLPVGNGVNAMFLEDKPASIIRRNNASLQLDIAVSPEENPVQVAKDLNRMLDSFKNA